MKNNILLGFLNQNKSSKNDITTHTRIGNKDLNIPWGAYSLNYNDDKVFEQFVKIYTEQVVKKGKYEYLTELQDRENGGPILIDLDFEIEKTETERFLDQSICFDMIDCYIENILKYFQIENDAEFEVFLLMKDEMNFDNNDYNKDGVHIQINLLMEHREQMFLREKTMKQINEDIIIPSGWNTFLKGDVEKIFDKSISSGMTGWLCYGSRKPGGKPYKLVNKYRVTVNDINEDPVDYSIEEISVSKKEYGKLFKDLLIRNCKHDKIKLKKEYEKSIVKKTKKAENKIIIKKIP